MILSAVAHEFVAFLSEAVGRERAAGTRAGNQCAALLAMIENSLLVTLVCLASPEPCRRCRNDFP